MTSPAVFEQAEDHFYAALERAALCDAASAAERTEHLEALATHYRHLQECAENSPETFENRVALLSAEIARIEGRDLDAMRLYELALRSARDNGFVHNEALTNEIASRFYAARGFEKIARMYLQDARDGYLRWGADSKARQLDQLHPHLREAERAPGPTVTVDAPFEQLDLATVVKASQALSGAIVPEKLIDTLMRSAIRHTGAERGVLILSRASDRIAAEAVTNGDSVMVKLHDKPATADALPESVLHHVVRTNESLMLNDATVCDPFSADPYIHQHRTRSILCVPLLNQDQLIGVLYLEKSSIPAVFAPARAAVLKLLASLAAVSLENARLYREVSEREARIRRLVDANIIGIFIWDFDGQILEANDAFLHMVGYDREDLVARRLRWTDLVPPESQERDAQSTEELKNTGICRPFEWEYVRKDGSRMPILIGAATFDEKENQGVAFVLDLTERKRAEDALRRSERYLSEAQRVSHVGSWIYNVAAGDTFHWSEEMFRIFGLGPHPSSARNREDYRKFYFPEDYDGSLEHFEKAYREKAEYSDDVRILRPDGTVRHLHVIGHPVLDEAGEVVEYFGTAMDVTERKQAEQALLQAQLDLAHVNRVSTMGQLTASIAHEINQPIAAARNNASAALRFLDRQPPALEEVKEALGSIVNDTHRAGDIVDRIRNLVKKAPPRKDRFYLDDAINEVIALVRSDVSNNEVSLQTRFPEGLSAVVGDRVQLQQVILNLILNAVESLSSAGDDFRQLLISTELGEANDVVVSVRDSGLGIDPENLERVFESFYTTKPGGLGMGLGICRSIIQAHGGRIWAEANQPRGVVFRFALPMEENQL